MHIPICSYSRYSSFCGKNPSTLERDSIPIKGWYIDSIGRRDPFLTRSFVGATHVAASMLEKNGKASGCNCLLQGCSDVLKWTWEDVVLLFALAYLGVWVKIGYPKNWMVNPKNQLKSVAPQVFNFDPHQFSSIFGWKSHQPLHGWAARDECLVVV